jgi:pimeloyl-ACP methyl ester carboxylesterase
MTLVQTVDGVRISYRARGEGPLTLPFMPLDLTGLLAIAMDLRGYGDSEDPDTLYTHERLAGMRLRWPMMCKQMRFWLWAST